MFDFLNGPGLPLKFAILCGAGALLGVVLVRVLGIASAELNYLTTIIAGTSTINDNLSIDGMKDLRVDVDVAVLDTGIDLDHPELNVVGGTDCMQSIGNGPPWKRLIHTPRAGHRALSPVSNGWSLRGTLRS